MWAGNYTGRLFSTASTVIGKVIMELEIATYTRSTRASLH